MGTGLNFNIFNVIWRYNLDCSSGHDRSILFYLWFLIKAQRKHSDESSQQGRK
jgi:hypothetical protein